MSDREFRLFNLVAAVEHEGESGAPKEGAMAWYMRTYHAGVQSARMALKEARLLGYVTEDSGHLFVTEAGKECVRSLAEAGSPSPAELVVAPRNR